MTVKNAIVCTLYAVLAAFPAVIVAADAVDSEAAAVYFPESVKKPEWISERRSRQIAGRGNLDAYASFSFQDIQPQSGLNFLHRIVDDAGVRYKAVHYDHGNGIAVADVDGDGLLDVYLVTQVGANGLYRNRGNGSFEDITEQAGVAVRDAIGVTASFADIDNDGDADLYVTNVRSPNVLFLNLGDGRFRDISAESGLAIDAHSSAATFFDYDRDGRLDLFLSVIGEYTTDVELEMTGTPLDEVPDGPPVTYFQGHRDAFAGHLEQTRQRVSRLFRNVGGNRFVDVTEDLELLDDGWTGDASPVDFDEDGWVDLYVLNMQGHDQYWRNVSGRRFVRQTEQVFPSTPWGSMGIKSFDFDNDGDLDLLLTDMHSDMSEAIGVDREKQKSSWIEKNWSPDFLRSNGRSIYGNALFRNDGGLNFEEVSDAMNAENYWPWGLSVADLNADGWQDVFITASMNYPFRYGPNTVLLNEGGKRFADAEYILGVEPRRAERTSKPWFRLDCIDAHRKHPDCAGRSTPVTVHGALGSRSSVVFDIDADGDLDIITSEFGDVPQVLLSDLAERRGDALNWLSVELVGTASNSDALGARVTVTVAEMELVQVNDGKSGYLSQSQMPLYFGLGDNSRYDRIEVTWPTGHTERFAGGPSNRLRIIEEQDD